MTDKTIFEKLSAIDCSAHIDKKETGKDRFGNPITLSYLSWAWAWDYFKKAYADAKYEIRHWEDKPYMYDEMLGYMVETSITAGGETHTMWLPVMDGTNSAMKSTPQIFKMKKKDGTTYDKTVAAATMFDINKAIMRCLVKNMAMFGLGLYIYAGEDLPSDSDETVESKTPETKPFVLETKSSVEDIIKGIEESMTLDNWKGYYKRAIELYPKGTEEYKLWMEVFNKQKNYLEDQNKKDFLDEEFQYLEQM